MTAYDQIEAALVVIKERQCSKLKKKYFIVWKIKNLIVIYKHSYIKYLYIHFSDFNKLLDDDAPDKMLIESVDRIANNSYQAETNNTNCEDAD